MQLYVLRIETPFLTARIKSTYAEILELLDGPLSELLIELRGNSLLDPWVLQGFHSRQTLRVVFIEELFNKVLGFVTRGVPDLPTEGPVTFPDFIEDLTVSAIERRSATQHDVQNHADAPKVTLLSVVALEDLRCDIVWSSISGVHGVIRLVIVVRVAEVDHFDSTLVMLVKEKVLWFEVAMGDVHGMAMSDGLEDLFQDFGCFELCHLVSVLDLLEEFDAVAQLTDQIELALTFINFIKPHNVWMVQVFEDVDLILEQQPLVLLQSELANDFNRSFLTVAALCRLVDLTKGTATDLSISTLVNLVVVDKCFHIFGLSDEVTVRRHYIFFFRDRTSLLQSPEILHTQRSTPYRKNMPAYINTQ